MLSVDVYSQIVDQSRVINRESFPIRRFDIDHFSDTSAEIGFTPDDLREIEGAASKITVQGARYPEKLEQMTGR